MTQAIDLSKLSVAEKDALILSLLPLVGQLETALARIAVLEAGNAELTARNAELQARLARLERPAKTPDNSSLPPSTGQKSDGPAPGAKPPRKGRPGVARLLEPNPDRIIDARLDACPHCAAEWADAAQSPQQVYDRIEMPPIRPDVTRVRLFGGRCVCCGARAVAVAPAGLEPGSPFGTSVEALVVYLHYAHAIGLERLRCLLGEIFGLSISEGALCNILARATVPLAAAAEVIAARITTAEVVASDETSVRVMKTTQWEWVFVTAVAVLHIIRPSRGAEVVRALFGSIRPRVWVSDSLGSQRGHADLWQMCLAHLLRDAQYAIDCGGLRARAEMAAAARDCHRATTRGAARRHACPVSRRSGPQARPRAGAAALRAGGRETAPPHRPRPRASVHLRHRPCRAGHQQRLRARAAPKRDLP